jgi:hypothetical protein
MFQLSSVDLKEEGQTMLKLRECTLEVASPPEKETASMYRIAVLTSLRVGT